mmetsp:Transcript_148119/g.258881  ORF Transcript_148119/g.258881 Transcript_148119/m.258881 type:complete len:272 (-) Transcript_148119:773-1588(-)
MPHCAVHATRGMGGDGGRVILGAAPTDQGGGKRVGGKRVPSTGAREPKYRRGAGLAPDGEGGGSGRCRAALAFCGPWPRPRAVFPFLDRLVDGLGVERFETVVSVTECRTAVHKGSVVIQRKRWRTALIFQHLRQLEGQNEPPVTGRFRLFQAQDVGPGQPIAEDRAVAAGVENAEDVLDLAVPFRGVDHAAGGGEELGGRKQPLLCAEVQLKQLLGLVHVHVQCRQQLRHHFAEPGGVHPSCCRMATIGSTHLPQVRIRCADGLHQLCLR